MINSRVRLMVQGFLIVLGIAGCQKGALSPSNEEVRLKVSGNRIVDMSGREVVLKGLNIGYPSTLIQKKRWSEDYFKKAAEWNARCIRILAFAKTRSMSWTAFVFFNDSSWPMPLFIDWNYTPSVSGAFFKKMLLDW
jgi:hypothetical protein